MNDDNNNNSNSPITINVLEEKLHVDKKLVEKTTIKVTKTITEENQTASIDLFDEQVEIKKVPVNTYVNVAPPVRYEGNVIIIPVVKEVLVIEKKLLLVEEVHVTKYTTTKEHTETVSLKKQEVIVNRIPSFKNTSL